MKNHTVKMKINLRVKNEEEASSKAPNKYVQKNHPEDQIIGNKNVLPL